MKLVIQRVLNSSVKVDNEIIGSIGKGYMVLVGVAESDTKEIADKLDMPIRSVYYILNKK